MHDPHDKNKRATSRFGDIGGLTRRGNGGYYRHMTTETVQGYRCKRCGYEWMPRYRNGMIRVPARCPKCDSRRWRDRAEAKG